MSLSQNTKALKGDIAGKKNIFISKNFRMFVLSQIQMLCAIPSEKQANGK